MICMVGVTSVLDNQDTFVLDLLQEVFKSDGIQHPVPAASGHLDTVTVRAKGIFAIKIKA